MIGFFCSPAGYISGILISEDIDDVIYRFLH